MPSFAARSLKRLGDTLSERLVVVNDEDVLDLLSAA